MSDEATIAGALAEGQEIDAATREEWRRSVAASIAACRENALAEGFVSLEMIQDRIFTVGELQADPLWERDLLMHGWHRRTHDFYLARAEAEARRHDLRGTAEISLNLAMLEMVPELLPQNDGPPYQWIAGVGSYETIASRDKESLSGHSTPGEAIQEWRRRLLAYVQDHPGEVLWWRSRPEIESWVPFGQTEAIWVVWCRALVGPVKFPIESYRLIDSHIDYVDMAEDARRAFADIRDQLPEVTCVRPDDNPLLYLHVGSCGEGDTLAEAAHAWGTQLLDAVKQYEPPCLYWRSQPEAEHTDIFGNGKLRWYVRSTATVPALVS